MELKLMSLLLLFIAGALGGTEEECEARTSDCPRRAGFLDFSVTDMFNLFTGDLGEFRRLCFNNEHASVHLPDCIPDTCAYWFSWSKYAYLLHMCWFIRDIEDGAHCWDSNFPSNARGCYEYHYPRWRTAYFPWPMRVYDRGSIARARFCFANEPNVECRNRKSDIMFKLMPAFYGL